MQPPSTPWNSWVSDQLTAVERSGQLRATRSFDAFGPQGSINGVPVLSFASNDYLGLSSHPAVIDAAHDALDRWGAGSTASRLIVGNRPGHDALEHDLAEWKGTEAALVFPTGYAANLGVLSVFGGPDATIISDELNHASIIDGCRLARSPVSIYGHGDLDHLDQLLATTPGRAIVVSDTVFSMDGDVADLEQLTSVCQSHRALLVVDEAHAVFGPEFPGEFDEVEILRVGTLSKTLGSLGGFVAGPRAMIELLVNRARSFIFTTASSPVDIAAAHQALRVLRSSEGDELLRRLRTHVDRLAPSHPSPIVPLVIGDEADALAAASHLLENGILVPAIRPPTVPPGTSRLRITLSAAHTDADLDALVAALHDLELT